VPELETELHTAQQDRDRVANAEVLLREWQAAIEALDLERTMIFYAGDATYEDPAQIGNSVYPAVMKGYEIKALYDSVYSLPEVSFEFTSSFVSVDGSKAVAEWVWRGGSGPEVEYAIRGVSLLEMQDGKIAREVIVYDTRNSPYQ
jgi:ketosteroid isomerase-like protein